MIKLSILDQLPIREGGKPIDPINEAIEVARLGESLGYQRYWTAQFHGTSSFTSAAPELVAARLAMETKTMRVGAGGILLSNYSPYAVAEQFRMLEVMFPGRIDLGIGRTTGGRGQCHEALLYGSPFGQESISQKIKDLTAFMWNQSPSNPAWTNVPCKPDVENLPEIWCLGSGGQSTLMAAENGVAFSFAHFINPQDYATEIQRYRTHFVPNEVYPEPQASLAVFAICADTEEEAIRLGLSRDLWWIEVFKGGDPPYRSLDAFDNYPLTDEDWQKINAKRDCVVMGTPEQVRDRIEELADNCGVDEVMVQTMTFDFEARKKSFRLLAEAFQQKS